MWSSEKTEYLVIVYQYLFEATSSFGGPALEVPETKSHLFVTVTPKSVFIGLLVELLAIDLCYS